MPNIVGTTTSVINYLSRNAVDLSIQNGNLPPEKIHLAAERKYVIPLFQREIRWEPANVNTLLSDLSKKDKFLGNIILSMESDNVCRIIDGQQRTTILFLIIACVKDNFGEAIELFETCPLLNESFEKLQDVIDVGFNLEALTQDQRDRVKSSDKYNQFDRIKVLWQTLKESEILRSKRKAESLITNLKSSTVNLIASMSNTGTGEEDSIQYFLDVNLKGIKLDTEDIFKGYLFSKDSRAETRTLWQDNKVLTEKFNLAKRGRSEKRYPLMKIYEHYFYCDLYLPRPFGEDYSALKFGENFCATSTVKIEDTIYYPGAHLIEIVSDRQYLHESLKKLNRCIKIMCDIAESDGPSDEFKQYFVSSDKVDSTHIFNCHSMLQKILLEKAVIPKILAMKYILAFFDGKEHTKEEYKSFYSIFTAAVLFTIFAPKKESETFYGFVRTENWIERINEWLYNYVTSHELTRGKLLAAYKYTEEDNEDKVQQIRCKSLAVIINFISVNKVQGKCVLKEKNSAAIKDFLQNNTKYSLEHFVVGEQGTLTVRTEKYSFPYPYPAAIKKYRNSLFNYIFIPQKINSALGNGLVQEKLHELLKVENQIECNYTKYYLKLMQPFEMYFSKYPKEEQIDQCTSEEEVRSLLDAYFSLQFPKDFLEFSMNLIGQIKWSI